MIDSNKIVNKLPEVASGPLNKNELKMFFKYNEIPASQASKKRLN